MRQVPGVESAAVILIRPISGSAWNGYLLADGAAERGSPDQVTWLNRISPGYFGTMKATLVAGRDFEERDKLGSPKVMIIGEKTARDFFGTRNPIGEFLREGYGTDSKGRFQIIGVVRDMKYSQVKEARRRIAFFALAQDEEPWAGVTILARVAGSAQGVTPESGPRWPERGRGFPWLFKSSKPRSANHFPRSGRCSARLFLRRSGAVPGGDRPLRGDVL